MAVTDPTVVGGRVMTAAMAVIGAVIGAAVGAAVSGVSRVAAAVRLLRL
jgi:hypothetical protein